jgi:hypothetical protein
VGPEEGGLPVLGSSPESLSAPHCARKGGTSYHRGLNPKGIIDYWINPGITGICCELLKSDCQSLGAGASWI